MENNIGGRWDAGRKGCITDLKSRMRSQIIGTLHNFLAVEIATGQFDIVQSGRDLFEAHEAEGSVYRYQGGISRIADQLSPGELFFVGEFVDGMSVVWPLGRILEADGLGGVSVLGGLLLFWRGCLLLADVLAGFLVL